MQRFVLGTVAGLLLTACGASGIGPGASSSPSPSAGTRFDVTAMDTDHAVTLRVGQTLEVVLHAGKGLHDWTHPTSSDQSVLIPIVDPAATAARGVTLAAFAAKAPGEAEVSATAAPLCSPGQACPMYIALYSLRVTVTL
jgi:hypothetical protein